MGYCVWLRDATFSIDRRRLEEHTEPDGYESPEEFFDYRRDDSGLAFQFDAAGDVCGIEYVREKLGASTVSLLDELGPLVTAGSVVVIEGEDGAAMTFSFDGMACKRSLVWTVGELVPGEDEVHPYWGEAMPRRVRHRRGIVE